mmetsp:Transcript_95327/g.291520  ORF Transcript_95327/g.291520 Transcript_95327/m.291520 type:complete len:246 (+) Transcript_95327:95-832(+)
MMLWRLWSLRVPPLGCCQAELASAPDGASNRAAAPPRPAKAAQAWAPVRNAATRGRNAARLSKQSGPTRALAKLLARALAPTALWPLRQRSRSKPPMCRPAASLPQALRQAAGRWGLGPLKRQAPRCSHHRPGTAQAPPDALARRVSRAVSESWAAALAAPVGPLGGQRGPGADGGVAARPTCTRAARAPRARLARNARPRPQASAPRPDAPRQPKRPRGRASRHGRGPRGDPRHARPPCARSVP